MPDNSVKRFIPDVLKRIGFNDQRYELLNLVEEKVTMLGRSAKLVGVKGGTIFVELGNSAEFQEARFRKGEILKALAQAFGPEAGPFELKFSLKGASQSMPKWIRVNPASPKIRKFSTRSKVTD